MVHFTFEQGYYNSDFLLRTKKKCDTAHEYNSCTVAFVL